MREPPFVIPVPNARYFLDDHCANCMEPLDSDIEPLFCSTWCSEISAGVRYMRGVFRDGRIDDPDVMRAVQTRNAFLLIGGYGALDRDLQPSVRAQVKARDNGQCRECEAPAAEIDHISGSSGELENLQLLCGDCHRAKTAECMGVASPEQQALLHALVVGRVWPEVPQLLGDDEVHWKSSWRGHKTARKSRLLSTRPAAVAAQYSVLKLEHADDTEYGPAMPRSVDESLFSDD